MELNEFKDLWKADFEKETTGDKLTEEKLNKIMMKATTTLTKLNHSNLYWWKFTKYLVIVLLTVLLTKAATLTMGNNSTPLINSPILYLGLIALFGLTTLWMYYELVKIFEVTDISNLKLTIEIAIKRFKRWYLMVNLIYLLLLPLVFFASLRNVLPAYHIQLSVNTDLIITVAVSVFILIANHINFKFTYFKWLNSMQKNLDELSE